MAPVFLTDTLERPTLSGKRLAEQQAARELLAQLDYRAFDPSTLRDALAAFPAPSMVGQDTWSGRGMGWREGRTFRLAAAPGLVSLETFDVVRRDRTKDRDAERIRRDADQLALALLEDGEFPEARPRRYISEWSAKSRTRMVRTFSSLDWSELLADSSRPLGMITLTYPGDWLTVVPSGRVLKRQLRRFLERWQRAIGSRLVGGWKLEFQARGAPHIHIITGVPAMVRGERFESWLSRTWASVVDARDPGERLRHLLAGTAVDFKKTGRMSDPKRLAVYFLGHSAKNGDGKEYQHNVPEEWQDVEHAPGRFWGFWGLPRAVEALDLDVRDFVTVRRVMRKVAAGRARRIARDRARARTAAQLRDLGAGTAPCLCGSEHEGQIRPQHSVVRRAGEASRGRRLRSLGVGGQLSGGFVIVNDGARLAVDLARAVLAKRGAGYPVRIAGSLVDLETGELLQG